jgi:hypothetical protein
MEAQILNSSYRELSPVIFPSYQGRQARYIEVDMTAPSMPKGFEDYSPMVEKLCRMTWREGTAYVTIDEKIIEAGMSQRRPHPHVDGTFHAGDGIKVPAWGGGGGGGWLHYCNDVGASKIGRMAVIVAASVAGCRAWKGIFEGRPAKDGDLSHIQDQLGEGEVLPENMGYLLSPDCVHESMTFEQNTLRQFIRIALPVSFAEASVWD